MLPANGSLIAGVASSARCRLGANSGTNALGPHTSTASQDLDGTAALGPRTLREPGGLEAVAPEHPDVCDWTWTNERFVRMGSVRLVRMG